MTTGKESTTREFPSWLDGYNEYVKDIQAPEDYKKWVGVATLGFALERRVWVYTLSQVFTNLYIFLVGTPGVGKSEALKAGIRLIQYAEVFNLLPNDLTGSALLDILAEPDFRKRMAEVNGEVNYEYHSAGMFISELGTMIRENDLGFMSILSDIYDCPTSYNQIRRGRKAEPIRIPHPQITIVAGTQPGYISSIFPNEAWSQGFMSRVILVHGIEPPVRSLFRKTKIDIKLEAALVRDLGRISKLEGEYIFSEEAAEFLDYWYLKDCPPKPDSHRLVGYNKRRPILVQKLAIIQRVSRAEPGQMIELHDVENALHMLLEVEAKMPNVFMEMTGRSDIDVIRDFHQCAWGQYVAKKKASLHESILKAWLSTRVPAYQIDKILQTCIQSHIIKREAGKEDMYIPQPRHVQGEIV